MISRDLKGLAQKMRNSLPGKKFLETDFDSGVLREPFKQNFLALPIGYMHIRVKSWDSQLERLHTDDCYGTGILRMFDRVRDLISLRGKGVVNVTVEPYTGRDLRAYLDLTWSNPELW